ncbi:MAG TPA: RsmG family class I SAM-dependent methyltransferase [Thermoanaerobaculia bacterium]|nr:RsmG family class I SAM-dependent methyltransferase [Thermoanaerobaculia bacterium]
MASLDCYRELLLTWSAKVNLIGPEARRNLDEHLAEALRAAEILEPKGEVLDFGSGGGLPAIPMALVSPEAHFHLVEADQKKWAFLKQAVRACNLHCEVHGDRLERLAPRLSVASFTLVTSRAVGKPESWVPWVEPLLKMGGRVALFEGTPAPPRIPGFEVERIDRLPRGEGHSLITLRKVPRGTIE